MTMLIFFPTTAWTRLISAYFLNYWRLFFNNSSGAHKHSPFYFGFNLWHLWIKRFEYYKNKF